METFVLGHLYLFKAVWNGADESFIYSGGQKSAEM